MSQRFESRCHHVEDRTLLAAEYLLGNIEGGLRRFSRQIEHFRLTVPMVLDQLISAMAMVVIDAAVRGQDQLNVELLNLRLRIQEVA